MGQSKILSTGVLVRDPLSVNAHVDVVNIDPALSQTVTVEIFDWGVDQQWSNPTPVPVSPPGPITIGPHTHRSFLALITQSTAQPSLVLSLYEIRVTLPDDGQLVVNCFALDGHGKVIEGNTVLHKELVEIGSALAGLCVNSIAELKALTAGVVGCLTVLGYYAPGDGGGGDFYWDASATEADNTGTIIAPASTPPNQPGRWKRLGDGPLSVKWFGAKGDGTTDDSTAIVNLIATKDQMGGATIYFPSGTYAVSSTIDWGARPCTILGDGWSADSEKGTLFKSSVSSGNAFTFLGDSTVTNLGIEIKGVGFYSSNPGNTATGLQLRNSETIGTSGIRVEKVLLDGFKVGLNPGNVEDCSFYDLFVQNCATGLLMNVAQDPRAEGLNNNQWYNTVIQLCTNEGILICSAANHTFFGGLVESNAVGVRLKPIDVLSPSRPELIIFDSIWFENNTGGGVVLDGSGLVLTNTPIVMTKLRSCHIGGDQILFVNPNGNLQANMTIEHCFGPGTDLTIPSWVLRCEVRDCIFGSIRNNSGQVWMSGQGGVYDPAMRVFTAGGRLDKNGLLQVPLTLRYCGLGFTFDNSPPADDTTFYRSGDKLFYDHPSAGGAEGQVCITAGMNPPRTWNAGTVFMVGSTVKPFTANGHTFICTSAGTTGAKEPAWNTGTGFTTNDGSVIWTENGALAVFREFGSISL